MTYHDPYMARHAAQELARQRTKIESTIAYLIDLLDDLDAGFEEVEPDSDREAEPYFG